MTLSQLPLVLGNLLTAVVCLIILRGEWRLTVWWQTLLGSLLLLFPLIATLRMLIVLFDVFSDLFGLDLWMVPISILEAIGLVGLIAAVGACSRRNPGGSERWFLSRAWIALGALIALQIALGIGFRWIAMSNDRNPNLQLIQGLSNMLGVIVVGLLVFKVAFVVFLIPWKRALTRCAKAYDSVVD